MARGDIHNSTGTICKAQSDATCPLSTDGGHSKDLESYVEYQVENKGVDGGAIRAMIVDGTPPADAVEVAMSGLSSTGPSLSREDEAIDDEIDEETYGYIRDLQGTEKAEAIANAERNLVRAYHDARREEHLEALGSEEPTEEELASVDISAVKRSYSNSLAAIHGVSKRSVIDNGRSVSVEANGETHVYNADFEKVGSFDTAEEDQINEDVYGSIRDLQGAEKVAAIATAESNLAKAYREGKREAQLDALDDDEPSAKELASVDLTMVKSYYGNNLAAIHGVAKSRVWINSAGDIEADKADGTVSVYSGDTFELKETFTNQSETDAGLKEFNKDIYDDFLADGNRNANVALAEKRLDQAYAEGKHEVMLDIEGGTAVEKERALRVHNRSYRSTLGHIRGVDSESVSEYRD